MTGWNLPPGCNTSDLPGNRPEDLAWGAFEEWCLDQFIDSGLDHIEARRAVLIGIAAIQAEKELVNQTIDDVIADARMCWEIGLDNGNVTP